MHAQHEETGWPSAIVGSADLFDPRAGETLEAQAKASPLMRGCRLQVHWHEHEAFRFAKSADAMLDPVFNENLELDRRARVGVRAAGVPEPAPVREGAARRASRT